MENPSDLRLTICFKAVHGLLPVESHNRRVEIERGGMDMEKRRRMNKEQSNRRRTNGGIDLSVQQELYEELSYRAF